MSKTLKENFFKRTVLQVAEDILGKYLVRRIDDQTLAGMITEVEAYDGPKDKANHASKGKTPRNEIMYAQGGYIYIYLIYGIHNMVNIVTGEEGYPAAILIRGTHEINGPGRLTKYYSIGKGLNKLKATPDNGLWIEDRGDSVKAKEIQTTPRVGIQSVEEPWASKPYRFILKNFCFRYGHFAP